MRIDLRVEAALALALALVLAAPPAAAADWQEIARLPWGSDDGEVGLHAGAEDELAYGPHGIAVDTHGRVAVVDRVGQRALLFEPDGAPADSLRLAGRPGAAALLPDGQLAVLDEAQERRVRLTGGEALTSPRWALPPGRLGVFVDGEGTRIWALDAFQLRLPLAPLPEILEPHEPPRGVPTADGSLAVVALRDGEELVLRFQPADGEVEEVRLTASLASDERLAGVEVLAVAVDGAVISYLGLGEGTGPLRARQVVAWVGRDGAPGTAVDVPAPGPVAIPAGLAATADGRVYLLRSGTAGCRLLRARVYGGGR
jgi:hypothetical protein